MLHPPNDPEEPNLIDERSLPAFPLEGYVNECNCFHGEQFRHLLLNIDDSFSLSLGARKKSPTFLQLCIVYDALLLRPLCVNNNNKGNLIEHKLGSLC